MSSFSDPFYYGISYNYDTAGNRTKLKVNGATYATYTYDSVNRLTNLADSASLNFTYNYDAANRLTSRSAPNGVVSSYAYDGLDRLTSLMHTAGGNTLNGNLYTYNNANNISRWTTASTQKTYSYNAVDRLTNVSNYEMPAENYSYDGVGNRTVSHLSASYGYRPFNKLTSTATATYNYDNNGNVISKSDASGTTTFTFNEENQLTQVALPSGLTVNYKYDGLGRRIQRTTSAGANERYVYDGPDALIDLNADWSVATTYLNGLGVDNHLRQTNSSTGVSYFLTDHLSSTSALTDLAGNVVEQVGYDSFGNNVGSARTRYTYTGRERDPDTGMLYYRARYYDPNVGRFIAEDPIGFGGGNNFYQYVGSSPLSFTDPSGLARCQPRDPAQSRTGTSARTNQSKECKYIRAQLLGDPRNRAALNDAWNRTQGGTRNAHEEGGLLGQVIDEGQPYQRDVRVNRQFRPSANSPRNSLEGYNRWAQGQISADREVVGYDYWYHTHPFEVGDIHPDTGARQMLDSGTPSYNDPGISRDLGGLKGVIVTRNSVVVFDSAGRVICRFRR